MSVRSSVCPSACISTETAGQISIKCGSGESRDLVRIEHKYMKFYMKIQVRFIVAGDINSPLKHFFLHLRVALYF